MQIFAFDTGVLLADCTILLTLDAISDGKEGIPSKPDCEPAELTSTSSSHWARASLSDKLCIH